MEDMWRVRVASYPPKPFHIQENETFEVILQVQRYTHPCPPTETSAHIGEQSESGTTPASSENFCTEETDSEDETSEEWQNEDE